MVSTKGVSRNTADGYRIDLSLFFKFMKCHKNENTDETDIEDIDIRNISLDFISSIKLADIYAFINYITLSRNNGSCARARKTSAIKQFFKYLYSINVIERDICVDLKPPKVKPEGHRVLTENESISLLESIDGLYRDRDLAIMTLILNCGLKISEITNLDMDDFQGGRIYIKTRPAGYEFQYINGETLENIKKYAAERNVISAGCSAFFISERKNRISKRTLQHIVQKYLRKADLGMYEYNANELRYTSEEMLRKYGSIDIYGLKNLKDK